jgi:hypothetical protein
VIAVGTWTKRPVTGCRGKGPRPRKEQSATSRVAPLVAREGSIMPSPTYFRFQADICLRLSLIASDEEVASRLLAMSRGYTAKADALEAQSPPLAPEAMSPALSGGETGSQ